MPAPERAGAALLMAETQWLDADACALEELRFVQDRDAERLGLGVLRTRGRAGHHEIDTVSCVADRRRGPSTQPAHQRLSIAAWNRLEVSGEEDRLARERFIGPMRLRCSRDRLA